MRARFIYEKFTQDSDPVYDLGIGIIKKLNRYSLEQLGYNKEPALSIIRKISEVLNLPTNQIFLLKSQYHDEIAIFPNVVIDEFLETLLTYDVKVDHSTYDINLRIYYMPEYINEDTKKIVTEKSVLNVWGGLDIIQKIGLKQMKEGILNEKFIQDSDPIKDMGIGTVKLIKNWIENDVKENGCHISDYYLDDDLIINATHVDISKIEYSVIPEYIKFGEVEYFACNFGKKELLKQLPKKITLRLRIFTDKTKREDIDFTKEDILEYCDVDINDIEIFYKSTGFPTFVKINEKFTQDSDPVHDLGIGILNGYFNFATVSEAENFFIEKCIPIILHTNKIPKDILGENGSFISEKYYTTLLKWYDKHITINKVGTSINPHMIGYRLYRRGFKVKCPNALKYYYRGDDEQKIKHIEQK